MTKFQTKFGARIKELRKRKNYTQEQFAELIDIGARSLRKIESGEGFPSPKSLEKIAQVLEVSHSELFNFEHLQSQEDLRVLIIEMIDSNPDKIADIYKVVKALVV